MNQIDQISGFCPQIYIDLTDFLQSNKTPLQSQAEAFINSSFSSPFRGRAGGGTPLNRHRRHRQSDIVDIGRPTSTMSVMRHKLGLSTRGRSKNHIAASLYTPFDRIENSSISLPNVNKSY